MCGTLAILGRRSLKRWSVLVAALGAILFLAGSAQAQEKEESTKLDCASAEAHLQPPPGMQGNCFQGAFAKTQGQDYSCRLFNYSIGFLPDGTEPRFHVVAKYPNKGGKVCAVIAFPNPTDAMQHIHKFVENGAKNWSAMQAAGEDINLMFFDAKNQTRDGKCFTFIKLGPAAGYSGKGHLYSLIGFFCKAPGQPLDTIAAIATVNAVRLKTSE